AEEAKETKEPAAGTGTVLEPAAAPSGPAQWPAGARSVSESYGDWTMNCTREDNRTDCVIIQSQGDRRTGKRLFSVELRVPKDGRTEGLILMPFGLQIEPGVTFKLDDRALGKGAPFSYCVADGCLVPISLPTLATDAMKTGQNLTVTAAKPDTKEPTVITVPLSGFAAAFARSTAFGS
ncbi:MAG: invasion associated locus B family protein, partial [Methylorubrum rhodinum]|uniref:invasion associated locus B family protein n=1 Tax=Methylorubrum rhodinum TaxID=29428 RepID=UPI003BAEB5EF